MSNSGNNLQNKNILLFAPAFFNYHVMIKAFLERYGAKVYLFDERNNPSSFKKILIRKAKFFVQRSIYQYYKKICNEYKDNKIDYILFVNPECLTLQAIKMLRKGFPNSIFILYMWDSLRNKNIEKIINCFDRLFSFDPSDCQKFNMVFRPLFFLPEFKSHAIPPDNSKYKYDFCFIGSIHSDRAKILYRIMNFCKKNNLSYYFYLYIPGKLLFCLRFCLDKYLRKIERENIHITPISSNKISSISAESRCIIDINHPNQNGLTMRTIEMLGLGKKILTTNPSISQYDFYIPSNQLIFDRNNPMIDINLIQKDYSPTPTNILDKYSIHGWIKDLFS